MDGWMIHLDFEQLFDLLPHFFEVVQDLPSEFLNGDGVAPQHPLACQYDSMAMVWDVILLLSCLRIYMVGGLR